MSSPYVVLVAATLAATLSSACQLAPAYDQPHILLPDAYRGSGPFRVSNPAAILSPGGDWWTLFGDPQLSAFEERLKRANPTLEAARQSYVQARDLAAEAQSHLYPQVGTELLTSDNKHSLHSLFRNADRTAARSQ
jgi:outer membrane protein, multidrug efflux system